MFKTLNSFYKVWAYESDATLKIFRQLTDESLHVQVHSNFRTLGRLANHLVETLIEMPHKMGLLDEENIRSYDTVNELVAAYEEASATLLKRIGERWTDDSLFEKRNMYGEEWRNNYSLQALVMHQCHHRGQMTVLMRLTGLTVPGLYGPAKEEWAAMNMQAPA